MVDIVRVEVQTVEVGYVAPVVPVEIVESDCRLLESELTTRHLWMLLHIPQSPEGLWLQMACHYGTTGNLQYCKYRNYSQAS